MHLVETCSYEHILVTSGGWHRGCSTTGGFSFSKDTKQSQFQSFLMLDKHWNSRGADRFGMSRTSRTNSNIHDSAGQGWEQP